MTKELETEIKAELQFSTSLLDQSDVMIADALTALGVSHAKVNWLVSVLCIVYCTNGKMISFLDQFRGKSLRGGAVAKG